MLRDALEVLDEGGISSSRASSSGARRIDEGCTVAIIRWQAGPLDELATLQSHAEVAAEQRLAAVAPKSTRRWASPPRSRHPARGDRR